MWRSIVYFDSEVYLALGDLGNPAVPYLGVKGFAIEHDDTKSLAIGLQSEACNWKIGHHGVHRQKQTLQSN